MSPVRSTAGGLVLASLAVAGLVGATSARGESTPAGTFSSVDQFITEQMEANAIPGIAVAITQGDAVLHVAGYGHDSLAAPVTADTLFQIASLSKSFTSLAVLQLADRGMLNLDDTVASRLPEFTIDDPRGASITIRQLLNQTSGLADSTSPDMSRPQPRSLTEAVAMLRTVHLASDPGSRWSYHNPNYQVAARLVEAVSGQPFNQYLRAHIFRPAGMPSSLGTTLASDQVPNLAQGHILAFGVPVPVPTPGYFSAGEGGIVSTAADMARWLIVNTNGGLSQEGTRLVSEAGFADWYRPGSPNGYALGWDTDGPAGHPTSVDHTGNQLTFGSSAAVLPESGYGVALLFNSSTAFQSDQTAIMNGVLEILDGGEPQPPASSPAGLSDALLAAIAVAALALGVRGALRSGTWARRNRGSWSRIAFRTAPYLVVLAVIAAFPAIASYIYDGRDVTWVAAFYGWPALVIAVICIGAAVLATIICRAIQLAVSPASGIGARGGT